MKDKVTVPAHAKQCSHALPQYEATGRRRRRKLDEIAVRTGRTSEEY